MNTYFNILISIMLTVCTLIALLVGTVLTIEGYEKIENQIENLQNDK